MTHTLTTEHAKRSGAQMTDMPAHARSQPANHAMTSGPARRTTPPSSYGHDFSRIPVNTPGTDNAAAASCTYAPSRCPFGGACHACPPTIQTKPLTSRPEDPYEREADRAADRVAGMTSPGRE